MSGSLLSDKQLNRLVTQKTNQSKDNNNSIIGVWTTQSPNVIQPFYPETGSTNYLKLEITENMLTLLSSFNSDYSNPTIYVNQPYKLVDNTIQINVANEDGMFIHPGYPIPNVSRPGGTGFHKFVQRTLIFTPSTNKIFLIAKFNLLDSKELDLFKLVLKDSGEWNVFDTSAEYIIEVNRIM